MSALAETALILAFWALAGAECVVVSQPPQPSARTARITVLRDGNPQRGVKLTVTMPNGQDSRSFVTDSQGAAVLRDLPEGTNCVVATDEDHFEGNRCLAVSAQRAEAMSTVTLTLADVLPPIAALDNKATPERLGRLDLAVLDLSGAAVEHAEVRVYRSGSYPNDLIARTWTGSDGRFTTPLKPDSYIVTVRASGFRSVIRAIEISPRGRDGEMREILRVGGC